MRTDVFSENPALHRYWYAVARSVDIMPGPIGITLLGHHYVVYRSESGELTAADDRCPHREARLSLGSMVDGVIQCAYHGWCYDGTGRCVRVPSSEPSVPPPPKAQLALVHVTERYGLVWVCPGEPAEGIPDIVEDANPLFRRINSPVETWSTSATRMVDNFVDISHFPWVHVGTFGRTQQTLVPKIELEPLDDFFFGYHYEVQVNNPLSAAVTSGQTLKVLTRSMSSGFHLPFTVRSTISYETGLEHILLLLSTPVDDVTAYFTFVVWRNDDFSVSAEDVIQFDRRIGAEDKAMLETVDGVLPLDTTSTVSVQADKPSVEWRRRFKALLERPPL
ncbi:MAG: aromatic ring-hydroxylating dioxygenase subunit alpha [Acidimicrobiales bacterium]